MVRMAEWPRMPYLNDELREWIAAQLATLGVDEIALYAVDPRRGQDEERRVLVATEVGLIDGWYAPRGGSSARYGFTARLWPWQAVRGVDLRNETYRVWALEHRTRWWLRLARPGFEAETDAPELGAALCDLAKVCAVMAEPAGWQAAQEEVPARRETLRVVPPMTPPPPEAGTDVERVAPTGRPAIPPPMATPAAPAPEPQPIRPAAEAMPGVAATGDPQADAHGASDAIGQPAQSSEAIPEAAGDESTGPSLADQREDGAPSPDAAGGDGGMRATEDPVASAVNETPTAEEHELPPGIETEAMDGPVTTEPAPVATAANTNGATDAPRGRDRGIGMSIGPFRRSAAPPAPAANGDAPLADEEEVLNLGEVGGGEEPITLDDDDPDPLGLRGPLHR